MRLNFDDCVSVEAPAHTTRKMLNYEPYKCRNQILKIFSTVFVPFSHIWHDYWSASAVLLDTLQVLVRIAFVLNVFFCHTNSSFAWVCVESSIFFSLRWANKRWQRFKCHSSVGISSMLSVLAVNVFLETGAEHQWDDVICIIPGCVRVICNVKSWLFVFALN